PGGNPHRDHRPGPCDVRSVAGAAVARAGHRTARPPLPTRPEPSGRYPGPADGPPAPDRPTGPGPILDPSPTVATDFEIAPVPEGATDSVTAAKGHQAETL